MWKLSSSRMRVVSVLDFPREGRDASLLPAEDLLPSGDDRKAAQQSKLQHW